MFNRRLKIVSADGTPQNTKVVDLLSGQPIDGIVKIEILMDMQGSKAILHILNPSVDISCIDGIINEPKGAIV